MSTISKFTPEELRMARRGGFKKKRPKKPKSKTLTSLESFVQRYNEWVRDLKSAASGARKADSLKKQLRNL